MNTWKRKSLVVSAIPLLALPSALGVYHWLEPARGAIGAASAAIGFEALYLGVAILALNESQRQHARLVSLMAVITAIAMNVLLDYASKVPNGLAGYANFIASFDVLFLFIALLDSVPLAGLAYFASTLMHRLSQDENQAREDAQQSTIDAQVALHDAQQSTIEKLQEMVAELAAKMDAQQGTIDSLSERENEPQFACPHCGSELASKGEIGAAKRWGYCKQCKGESTNGNGHNGNGHGDSEDVASMPVVWAFEGENEL